MKRVLFAAGGTMGHLGPAIAVAEALAKRDPRVSITFVGTRSAIESTTQVTFPRRRIVKAPLPRKVGPDLLLFPIRLLIALMQSIPLVLRADIVVGFGGYVATPVYLAARLTGRRIILHEANALPGFANRVGRTLGAECYVNFEAIGREWNAQVIGMPLREGIIDLVHRLKRSPSAPQSDHREILVIGGSQGSMRINEAIWESLDRLDSTLRIVHAVGEANLEKVPTGIPADRYRAVGFIEDMAKAYERADLVIARAGAVTCAELLALGKRAILIPLGHGNGEQAINARSLVESGNAISIDDRLFDADWLVTKIDEALDLPAQMPANPLLDATAILVEAILDDRRAGS